MKVILLFIIVLSSMVSSGQTEADRIGQNVRINFINPGIEYELPFSKLSSVLFNVGVGVGGSYKNLTDDRSGYKILVSPFYEMQYRNYYNLSKRIEKNKNVANNSANFVGVRGLARGPELLKSTNFYRSSELDYAVGAVWGMQRSLGKRISFVFDMGLYTYFDMKGNSGVAPLIELNVGYNLSK